MREMINRVATAIHATEGFAQPRRGRRSIVGERGDTPREALKRLALLAVLSYPLGGCFFVYIPPTVTYALEDGITAASRKGSQRDGCYNVASAPHLSRPYAHRTRYHDTPLGQSQTESESHKDDAQEGPLPMVYPLSVTEARIHNELILHV